MDITALLCSLGLEQYAQTFRDHSIDADILPKLTAEDLKDMGVAAVGHRRRLLDAFGALSAGAPADAPLHLRLRPRPWRSRKATGGR